MKHPFSLFDLTNTITALIRDIIDAQIAGDEEEIQNLMEELDSLYDARSEKYEGYIHSIAARSRAMKNLAQRLKTILLHDLKQPTVNNFQHPKTVFTH